jgi:hypothetical protein
MGKSSDPLKLLNPHAMKVLQMYGGITGDSGPPQVGGGAPGGGQPPRGPQGGDPLIYGALGDAAGGQASVAQGATRTEYDSKLAGAINQMIRMGRPTAEINAYVKAQGGTPPTNIAAAQAYLKQHPGYKGNFVEATRQVPNTMMERISGSAPAAAVSGAANALTMGFQDEMAGGVNALTSGDYTQGRDAFNARKNLLADSHPAANMVGNVAGGAAGLIGGEAALGRFAPGALKLGANAFGKYAPMATDAAYGAAYGAGEDNQNRLGGAIGGGLTAAAGGAVARGVTRGVGSAIAPDGGKAAPLYELGAHPTIGQRFANSGPIGKAVNTVEQAMQSIPGLGYAVSRARDIPRNAAQVGLFNDALNDIGRKLPPGMGPGTDPHLFANKAFNSAYDKARSGMKFAPDAEYVQKDLPAFVDALHDGTLDAQQAKQVKSVIKAAVASRLKAGGGQLAGDQYKAAAAQLQRTADAWARHPNSALQAGALHDFIGVFDAAARRSSKPASVKALDSADRGYAKLVRIQQAAQMAGGESGTFTPAQFRSAVQKTSGGVRSKAYNEGNALSQKYSDAMMNLQDTLPNSGSADRLFIGQLAGGSAAGTATALGAPTALLAKPGGAAMLPYLPGANFLTTRAMTPRNQLPLPPKAVAALEDIRNQVNKRSRMFGRLGAVGALGYNEP